MAAALERVDPFNVPAAPADTVTANTAALSPTVGINL
jgi:hypothetical protein